jgi:hypothetical protein
VRHIGGEIVRRMGNAVGRDDEDMLAPSRERLHQVVAYEAADAEDQHSDRWHAVGHLV